MMEFLHKHRLDSNGKKVSEETIMEKNQFRGNIYQRTKKEMDDKQGCHMVGYVRAYRVPGNVHIASHPYQDIVAKLKDEGYHFDFSYNINHVSMGNKEDFDYIQKHFQDLQMEHPCDGIKYKQKFEEDGKSVIPSKTNFYMVAVPSYFEKSFGRKYHVYQLISSFETTHDPDQVGGD